MGRGRGCIPSPHSQSTRRRLAHGFARQVWEGDVWRRCAPRRGTRPVHGDPPGRWQFALFGEFWYQNCKSGVNTRQTRPSLSTPKTEFGPSAVACAQGGGLPLDWAQKPRALGHGARGHTLIWMCNAHPPPWHPRSVHFEGGGDSGAASSSFKAQYICAGIPRNPKMGPPGGIPEV